MKIKQTWKPGCSYELLNREPLHCLYSSHMKNLGSYEVFIFEGLLKNFNWFTEWFLGEN